MIDVNIYTSVCRVERGRIHRHTIASPPSLPPLLITLPPHDPKSRVLSLGGAGPARIRTNSLAPLVSGTDSYGYLGEAKRSRAAVPADVVWPTEVPIRTPAQRTTQPSPRRERFSLSRSAWIDCCVPAALQRRKCRRSKPRLWQASLGILSRPPKRNLNLTNSSPRALLKLPVGVPEAYRYTFEVCKRWYTRK